MTFMPYNRKMVLDEIKTRMLPPTTISFPFFLKRNLRRIVLRSIAATIERTRDSMISEELACIAREGRG
jgi:hypothetical protein